MPRKFGERKPNEGFAGIAGKGQGALNERASKSTSRVFVAVDTGGTFTDLLMLSDGELRRLKVASTPTDPSRAVLDGIRALGLGSESGQPRAGELPAPSRFVLLHGTTVATNALLERKGARVGLITNRGFEDVLEIGRQNRPQLYALVGKRKPPLAASKDRLGVEGRLDPRGRELIPLDPDELAGLASWAAERDAVAVCLLHSYANSVHEESVAEALGGCGVPVSVSCRLLPEFREYERTSTTVVNAFVAPVVSGYLARLESDAGAERVDIMGSNGGTVPVRRAAREPVHTVLSGPAGGVVAALHWGRAAGFDDVITFDMGGTSTDVSLCPGRPLRTRDFAIDGQPVAVPVLDIHTVGAGGGSIARVDAGGALKVGPESAGADPGPVCYGKGGRLLTVTDAHVWLGRLPASEFLGGAKAGAAALDREAIAPALGALAEAMGTGREEAAEGVLAVADSAMERALRVISVERGYDPKAFCLVAFGGAGGLHVAELAARIGVRRALVPPSPGLLSAFGMLVAPVTREVSRTVLRHSDDPKSLEPAFAELRAAAAEALRSEGYGIGITVACSADVRYVGQSFELRVPADDWIEAFHAAHEERYGYARRDSPVEAVTLRAVARVPPQDVRVPGPGRAKPPRPRAATVLAAGGSMKASLYRRSDLGVGARLVGPAIVTEYSGTTWVPDGWECTVVSTGSLLLERPSQ